jgi:hypothetical protein
MSENDNSTRQEHFEEAQTFLQLLADMLNRLAKERCDQRDGTVR